MRPSFRAALVLAAALALTTPTTAIADQTQPDGDTAVAGKNITYGPTGRACNTRGSAVNGVVTVSWNGSSHLTAGENLQVSFTTPAGVTATATGSPKVPAAWTAANHPDFTIPFTTTVSNTSLGGKVDITVRGESSGVEPDGKPNFQVAVDCADTTPPVIGYTLNPPTPGAGQWYNVPVTIDWTVTDPESPATLTGCADSTQSAETTAEGVDFSCSATSTGGAAGPVVVNLKVDTTAPTVTPTITGTVGDDGWYTSNATLHWNVDDALSGLQDANACPDVPVNTDQAETTYFCTVVDRAGNSTTNTAAIKRDATAPIVSSQVTGTPGSNGWYTTAVTIDWTTSDPTSGIQNEIGCVDRTVVDADGEVTSTCSAENGAGLTTAGSPVTVKVDSVAPVVAPNVTGTLGLNGWYVSDVLVSWDYTEGGSGVVDACSTHPVDSDTDADGDDFSCTVHDAAGNTSNTANVTIRRDMTAPSVSHVINGTLGNNDWYVSDVDVDFSYSDATSGLGVLDGCTPDPWATDTSAQTLTCTVHDNAGNSSSDSVTFKRDATVPGISGPVVAPTPAGNDGTLDWWKTDVSLTWSCTDNLSGAVNDSIVKNLTAEGAGQTQSATCQDQAGNTAGDTSDAVNIDKTAPALNISGPASGSYELCATGGVAPTRPTFGPTDDLSGVASSSDSWTTPANPSGVGTYVYSAQASDHATNGASETRNYSVVYGGAFSGILQPVNADGSSRFKLGSTVPVKFRLTCNGVPITNAVSSLTVKKYDGTADPGVDEAISTSAATTGNLFRYSDGQYIFNLSTKQGYTNPGSSSPIAFATGTWTLTINLDDSTHHNVRINLVK